MPSLGWGGGAAALGRLPTWHTSSRCRAGERDPPCSRSAGCWPTSQPGRRRAHTFVAAVLDGSWNATPPVPSVHWIVAARVVTGDRRSAWDLDTIPSCSLVDSPTLVLEADAGVIVEGRVMAHADRIGPVSTVRWLNIQVVVLFRVSAITAVFRDLTHGRPFLTASRALQMHLPRAHHHGRPGETASDGISARIHHPPRPRFRTPQSATTQPATPHRPNRPNKPNRQAITTTAPGVNPRRFAFPW